MTTSAAVGMAKRYVVLAEGCSGDPHYGKTARGILDYGLTPVVAMLDSKRAGEVHGDVPIVGSLDGALRFAPTTAVVGVATSGGRFPPAWRDLLRDCVVNGLDIENGLHQFIEDDTELSLLADRHGVRLRDLRRPPEGLDVPNGENLRLGAKIVLTVGSDCAIGKMTVSLELNNAARSRSLASVFVPTGQTGIAIAGWGIAVDAVVSDFIAGAAERLVVEGAGRGGELLMVEGQGSITHPAYSGVTIGLMHGSAPHAFVLCHQAGAREHEGFPGHPLPSLRELVELHERISLPARPAKVVAIALNTRLLDESAARVAIAESAAETGVLTDDPVRFGPDRLLDAVLGALGLGEKAHAYSATPA